MKSIISTICFVLSLLSASAQAAVVTVVGRDMGNDVVFTVNGSFDTSGLATLTSGGIAAAGVTGQVNPSKEGFNDPTLRFGSISFGETPSPPTFSNFSAVNSYFDPSAVIPVFGTTSNVRVPDLFSGDAFGFKRQEGIANGVPFSEAGVTVQEGYVSLDLISAEMTFFNVTLATMGFEEGFYSFNFGNNVINIDLTNTAAVPLPAAAPFFLAGLFGIGFIRRTQNKSGQV